MSPLVARAVRGALAVGACALCDERRARTELPGARVASVRRRASVSGSRALKRLVIAQKKQTSFHLLAGVGCARSRGHVSWFRSAFKSKYWPGLSFEGRHSCEERSGSFPVLSRIATGMW